MKIIVVVAGIASVMVVTGLYLIVTGITVKRQSEYENKLIHEAKNELYRRFGEELNRLVNEEKEDLEIGNPYNNPLYKGG